MDRGDPYDNDEFSRSHDEPQRENGIEKSQQRLETKGCEKKQKRVLEKEKNGWKNMIEVIIGLVLTIGAGLFAYVTTVIVHEERTGKPYRMFWEWIVYHY